MPTTKPHPGGVPRRLSRRRFLGLALSTSALATVGGTLLERAVARPASERAVARYALVIDVTECTGCGACAEACRLRNKLPHDLSDIRIYPKGDQHVSWFLPVQCQHCANPPCAAVCPTNAT